MASPAFSINGGAVNTKASVSAGGAVVATLDSTLGVRQVAWSIVRTDETSVVGDYTLTPAGAIGEQVSTTALLQGTSAALQCTINGGIDFATDAPSSAMTQVVKFYVPLGTFEVLNGGELEDDNRESSSSHGAVDPLNKAIRAAAGASEAYKEPVQAATTAALPANTFDNVAGTITINAVGVFPNQDGVASTQDMSLLVKNEGGGTSAANGIYTLTTLGTAGSQAVLTRRDDADTTGDLVGGTMVVVTEGTVNADQIFVLATNDPIVINTTAQTWSNWGVIAPLVTTTTRGTVNSLGAASTVLTTDGATAGGGWTTIVDAHVNAAAAIAGTKVAPDFGAQNVRTTGTVTGTAVVADSAGTANYMELGDGTTAAVSAAGDVRIRSNAGVAEFSENAGPWTPIIGGIDAASWSFVSPAGGGATFYAAGFYVFGASANDFGPAITLGTVNSAYGARVGFVAGPTPGGDTTIRVTGTSITDAGVRTGADTEDVVFLSGDATNTYRQTTKKWIGQVTLSQPAGLARMCNYGLINYYGHNATAFTVAGVDVTWRAGASDAGIEIKLRHHKAAGWTYNAGAEPTPPAELCSMTTDYGAESEAVNQEPGQYARTNLSVAVNGADSEGILFECVTTVANTFQFGTANLLHR